MDVKSMTTEALITELDEIRADHEVGIGINLARHEEVVRELTRREFEV